jgi:hypothetical protein
MGKQSANIGTSCGKNTKEIIARAWVHCFGKGESRVQSPPASSSLQRVQPDFSNRGKSPGRGVGEPLVSMLRETGDDGPSKRTPVHIGQCHGVDQAKSSLPICVLSQRGSDHPPRRGNPARAERTGKSFSSPGANVIEVWNGRISKILDYYDRR